MVLSGFISPESDEIMMAIPSVTSRRYALPNGISSGSVSATLQPRGSVIASDFMTLGSYRNPWLEEISTLTMNTIALKIGRITLYGKTTEFTIFNYHSSIDACTVINSAVSQ